MKTQHKKQLLELLSLLDEAHDYIKRRLVQKDVDAAAACLEECQSTAIAAGTDIDSEEGEGTSAVSSLESYCELVYQIYEQILNGEQINPGKIHKKLHRCYADIVNKVKYDIPEIKEIVFLPYKASMWDSLESVWKKADADPNCDAKVIPIPYYDRNPDGSFCKLHYEGADFPRDVPVFDFKEYDFEKNHPDEIYIHNPYDDCNIVTSVHPFFYSKNLKKYTDKLIYIPYFVLEEVDLNDRGSIGSAAHFAQVPGVINADLVIVQSENMRQFYIESMVMFGGEQLRETFENKIVGSGSPKIEKILSMKKAEIDIPENWKDYILKNNGTKKKIIIYNTSVSALLKSDEKMLSKMEEVFAIFKKHHDEIALLWRPHPLIESTISSMRPQLWERYQKIVEIYKQEDFGIYDDSPDMDRALVLADAYYGDKSSLVTLCKTVGLPIMIQNVDILYEGVMKTS